MFNIINSFQKQIFNWYKIQSITLVLVINHVIFMKFMLRKHNFSIKNEAMWLWRHLWYCFYTWSHKNPIWDSILIYITEVTIKSNACMQSLRPRQKFFSRIYSYLLCNTNNTTSWISPSFWRFNALFVCGKLRQCR